MSELMTRTGRITKNKWLVVRPSVNNRVISRHRYKSVAMNKAVSMTERNGKEYWVAKVEIDHQFGDAIWYPCWSTTKGRIDW